MIYLYLKTHNVTGLKYLGKTVRDPFTYKGSGKRWLNHIKKHGNDVTTKILFQTTCTETFKQVSSQYSESFNIVESNDWANLRPETGDGGDTSKYIDYSSIERGRGRTYEEMYGADKAVELKKLRAECASKNRKGKKYEEIFGEEKAHKLRKLRSEIRTRLNKGNKHSEETKKKISMKASGKKQTRCSCLMCGKEIGINNLTNHYKIHD